MYSVCVPFLLRNIDIAMHFHTSLQKQSVDQKKVSQVAQTNVPSDEEDH